MYEYAQAIEYAVKEYLKATNYLTTFLGSFLLLKVGEYIVYQNKDIEAHIRANNIDIGDIGSRFIQKIRIQQL